MHISNSMQFNDEKLIHVNVVQFVIFVDVVFVWMNESYHICTLPHTSWLLLLGISSLLCVPGRKKKCY